MPLIIVVATSLHLFFTKFLSALPMVGHVSRALIGIVEIVALIVAFVMVHVVYLQKLQDYDPAAGPFVQSAIPTGISDGCWQGARRCLRGFVCSTWPRTVVWK
jgi:hypothetical protein